MSFRYYSLANLNIIVSVYDIYGQIKKIYDSPAPSVSIAHLGLLAPNIKCPLILISGGFEYDSQPSPKPSQERIC